MRIKSIKKIKPERVYAVQTKTETFVSDGLAHHNCTICNRNLNGNYKVYEPKIRQELGTDFVQKMWDKALKAEKISTPMLSVMLEKIKEKYKNFQKSP